MLWVRVSSQGRVSSSGAKSRSSEFPTRALLGIQISATTKSSACATARRACRQPRCASTAARSTRPRSGCPPLPPWRSALPCGGRMEELPHHRHLGLAAGTAAAAHRTAAHPRRAATTGLCPERTSRSTGTRSTSRRRWPLEARRRSSCAAACAASPSSAFACAPGCTIGSTASLLTTTLTSSSRTPSRGRARMSSWPRRRLTVDAHELPDAVPLCLRVLVFRFLCQRACAVSKHTWTHTPAPRP